MKQRTFAIALTAGILWAGAAGAQTYPTKPVTMVVPFAAGGPTDALARLIAERMRVALGQPILIENVTGAGGSVGVGRVVRAAPDGYTVSIGHLGTHVINGALYTLPYDLVTDLEPVAMLPSNPLVIVSKTAVPAKELKELIAWLKANQDKATAGTAGVGSASHVGAVYFQNLTGLRVQLVPYRGTGPALLDLVAGQIDMVVDQTSNSMPHIRGGKIRAYAVTAPTRVPSAPEIPTVDEAGLPGFHISIWNGFWVPKGTPKQAVARLNAAAMEAMADPAVRKRLADVGLDVPPRESQSAEALGAHQKAEIAKWWPVIKAANIKAQ
jgi:tripartite-type tricarboxylate transporter receptor subunit TctC